MDKCVGKLVKAIKKIKSNSKCITIERRVKGLSFYPVKFKSTMMENQISYFIDIAFIAISNPLG